MRRETELGGLLQSSLTARADESSRRLAVALEPHGLQVGGHATVRADTVHTHGLWVEAAH